MIDLTDCMAIGTIIKAHGIKGQVVLRLDHFKFDEIHSLEPVFLEVDGLPVPFFVSGYYEKDPETLIVSFDDYNTEDDLLELMNSTVFIPLQNILTSDKMVDDFRNLTGYEVRDSVHGKLGILIEIIHYAHNPLFRVADKKREIHIPVQPSFILGIDQSKRIIHVQVPDGLLEI